MNNALGLLAALVSLPCVTFGDEFGTTADQYPRIIAEWQEAQFVPINIGTVLSNQVAMFSVTRDATISAIQESELRRAVYNMMVAYHDGGYEAYRRFRIPSPARPNPQYIEKMRLMAQDVPNDDAALLKWMLGHYNRGKGLQGFWIGFAPSTVDLAVRRYDKSPEPITVAAQNRRNAGFCNPIPSVLFERSPEKILADSKSLLIASFHILIQHGGSNPSYPYLCRFYWDEKNRVWLPMDFAFLFVNTSQLNRVPMF